MPAPMDLVIQRWTPKYESRGTGRLTLSNAVLLYDNSIPWNSSNAPKLTPSGRGHGHGTDGPHIENVPRLPTSPQSRIGPDVTSHGNNGIKVQDVLAAYTR